MGSLSILAISIASIGLFGMVVFTTETRLREISIRKVLGANESTLVFLLSKESQVDWRCTIGSGIVFRNCLLKT